LNDVIRDSEIGRVGDLKLLFGLCLDNIVLNAVWTWWKEFRTKKYKYSCVPTP